MNDAAVKLCTQEIVVDEVFPHSPETIWKALTNGALMGRWLMPPTGFEAVKGNRFTFQTTPAGEWDGRIRCQIIEVVANQRLAYSWQGGHETNIGYGSKLDTIVTWTRAKASGGTHVRIVHSGFVTPRNDSAFKTMSQGWVKVVERLRPVADEQN